MCWDNNLLVQADDVKMQKRQRVLEQTRCSHGSTAWPMTMEVSLVLTLNLMSAQSASQNDALSTAFEGLSRETL